MRSTILAAVEVAGKPPLAKGTGGPVGWRAVTPDYFSALAIPILAAHSDKRIACPRKIQSFSARRWRENFFPARMRSANSCDYLRRRMVRGARLWGWRQT
jgi:hypothetical protein